MGGSTSELNTVETTRLSLCSGQDTYAYPWTKMRSMQHKRACLGAAVLNHTIHVAGGQAGGDLM